VTCFFVYFSPHLLAHAVYSR